MASVTKRSKWLITYLTMAILLAIAVLCLPLVSVWRTSALPPLHAAAASGDVAPITAALDGGANPNERVERSWGEVYDGMTPLMLAASTGQADAIQLLIERGADPALVDPRGRSAAEFAALSGSDQAVAHLTPRTRKAESPSDP